MAWATARSPSPLEIRVAASPMRMRPDAIIALGPEKAPNLHRLITGGASTMNARTDADMTVTLPNHTAMVTGRGVKGDAGHGWTSNATPRIGQMLHRNRKAYLRSMFGVAHDRGLRTALFHGDPLPVPM